MPIAQQQNPPGAHKQQNLNFLCKYDTTQQFQHKMGRTQQRKPRYSFRFSADFTRSILRSLHSVNHRNEVRVKSQKRLLLNESTFDNFGSHTRHGRSPIKKSAKTHNYTTNTKARGCAWLLLFAIHYPRPRT